MRSSRSASNAGIADSVWSRHGSDELGEHAYVFLLNLWVVLGLAASGYGAYVAQTWVPGWWMLVGLVPFAGAFVSLGSRNPVVSLVGYAMIVFPLGLTAGPMIGQYTGVSVLKVALLTGFVSAGLGGVGTLFPDLLRGWGKYLFAGLLFLVFGQLFAVIAMWLGVQVDGTLAALDWFGAFLFSAYIAYDYGRAMRVPRTLDNSVDCAVAIYLDIWNLFLILVRREGTKKS